MNAKDRQKYASYLCLLIGFLSIFYGLLTYLEGPSEVEPSKLDCVYSEIVEIKPNSSVHYSFDCEPNNTYQIYYSIWAPSLVIDRGINTSIKVEGVESIDVYLMNSTQIAQWNDSHYLDFTGQVIELGVNKCNINFRSYNDTKHWLLLANKQNKTIIASVNTSWFTTIKVFNYDRAFNGLLLALVGGLILLVTFALGNPLNKLRHRMITVVKFPGLEEYYALQEKTKYPAIEFIFVGALALISFFIFLFFYFRTSSSLPPQLLPITRDWCARILLFNFFIGGVHTVVTIEIANFIFLLINDFILWWFVVKNDIQSINLELEKQTLVNAWEGMKSPLSLLLIMVTVVVVFSSLWYVFFAPLGLLFGYILSVAHYKACKQLKLEYEKELRTQRFNIARGSISCFLMLVIITLFWIKSVSFALDSLFKTILAPSIAMKINWLNEITTTRILSVVANFNFKASGWIIFLGLGAIGGFALCALFFSFLNLPIEECKKLVKSHFKYFLWFVFSLIFIKIVSIISTGTITPIPLRLLLGLSFSSYCLTVLIKELHAS